jgi:hypothetical protein
MAEVPRYPRQYRVHDAVFSLFLIQVVTSVIETLGNPEVKTAPTTEARRHGEYRSGDRA